MKLLALVLITIWTWQVCSSKPTDNSNTRSDVQPGSCLYHAIFILGFSSKFLLCEGAIINKDYVITAAACLDKYKSLPDKIQVAIGARTTDDIDSNDNVQRRTVSNIEFPPEWFASNKQRGDIAVAKLSKPIEENSYVRSAKYGKDVVVNAIHKLIGYGNKEQLAAVPLKVESEEKASDSFKGTTENKNEDLASFAGAPVTDDDSPNYIHAIASGRESGLFTKISIYKDWIKNIIKSDGDDDDDDDEDDEDMVENSGNARNAAATTTTAQPTSTAPSTRSISEPESESEEETSEQSDDSDETATTTAPTETTTDEEESIEESEESLEESTTSLTTTNAESSEETSDEYDESEENEISTTTSVSTTTEDEESFESSEEESNESTTASSTTPAESDESTTEEDESLESPEEESSSTSSSSTTQSNSTTRVPTSTSSGSTSHASSTAPPPSTNTAASTAPPTSTKNPPQTTSHSTEPVTTQSTTNTPKPTTDSDEYDDDDYDDETTKKANESDPSFDMSSDSQSDTRPSAQEDISRNSAKAYNLSSSLLPVWMSKVGSIFGSMKRLKKLLMA